MNKLPCVSLAVAGLLAPVMAEEVAIKNKKGVEIQVEVLELGDDSVKVAMAGGNEFDIKFDTLAPESVAMLKKREEDRIAAEEAAEAARLARIPKFPEAPGTLNDLPEKVVVEIKGDALAYATFDQVEGHFIAPRTSVENPGKDKPMFEVFTAFAGGTLRAFISQSLSEKPIMVKYVVLTEGAEALSEPKELTIPSAKAKSDEDGSAGSFSEKLPGSTVEVAFYDFREAQE